MTPTRRAFLRTLLAAPIFGASAAPENKLPSTGETFAGLAPFDDAISAFVEEQKIPGCAMAITREGKLVYARGFGYADPDKKEKFEPNSLCRLASVSKTLTGPAILKLVEQDKLKLDDKALDYIKLEPVGKLDARWPKITIRHLLQHTAGWDRDRSPDFTGRPGDAATALRVPQPVTSVQLARYVLGRPLDFDPGAKFVYANAGYLMLGRVIETVTRGAYDAFVKKELLAPLGITYMQMGREMPENRARNEVHYYDRKKQKGACLYPPRRGQVVPVMDGAFNYEAHDSFGGWLASAVDLVRYASSFDDPEKSPILKASSIETMFERPDGAAGNEGGQPRPTYYGCGWSVRPLTVNKWNAWHEGLMPGSCAAVYRYGAVGVCWAVVFNMDLTPQNTPLSMAFEGVFGQAGAKVTAWPDKDLFPMYLMK
jgi:N-acyl-D-amino-acid deacylase